MRPATILFICLLTFANSNYDDDSGDTTSTSTTSTTFDDSGDTSTSTSTSTSTTTSTFMDEELDVEDDNWIKYTVLGGIVGGLGVIGGLIAAGRQLCKKSKKEKEKDDKDLEYDYYGIIQRRLSSSYV